MAPLPKEMEADIRRTALDQIDLKNSYIRKPCAAS